MSDYRFIFDKSSKKFICPNCNKRRFVRYVDQVTSEYLPEKYGKCDRADNCPPQDFNNPYKDGYAKLILEQGKPLNQYSKEQPIFEEPKPLLVVKTSESVLSQRLFETELFTEIKTYAEGNDPDGVLCWYSLESLSDRLNTFKKCNGDKFDNPAILKGIYKNGTSGEFCDVTTPFLFFDIDVKTDENSALLEPDSSKRVFEYLTGISILAWRSNSGNGIAGMLYTPGFEKYTNDLKEDHHQSAKMIYHHLSGMVLNATGIDVVFDNAQGRFRQIRYLAEQKEPKTLNLKPIKFEITEYGNTAIKSGPVPFDFGTFKKTLESSRYALNTFIQNLMSNVPYPFPVAKVTKVIELYRLGTIVGGYKVGSVTFPYIDKNNVVRAIQVRQFDKNNHGIGNDDFLHSILIKHNQKHKLPIPEWLKIYEKQDKVTCFFGEHLLNKFPNNSIGFVEAPKTAIYCTLYFGLPETDQDLIWIAAFNKEAFNFEKAKVFHRRTVYIFPDLSATGSTFKQWETKAREFEQRLPGSKFIVSDLLERFAPEDSRNQGNDIADFIIQHDWREYQYRLAEVAEVAEVNINYSKQPQPQTPTPPRTQPDKPDEPIEINPDDEWESADPETWQPFEWIEPDVSITEFDFDLPEIIFPEPSKDLTSKYETFFSSMTLPSEPIKLNPWTTIIDLPKFIDSSLAVLQRQGRAKSYLPYLERLEQVYQMFNS